MTEKVDESINELPSNNEAKRNRGRFAPGNNTGRGRPQGSRNKATIAMEELLDSESKALTRKAIDMALQGDTTALRLCLERLCPPRKERPITCNVPKMESLADSIKVMEAIANDVTTGNITPGEGVAVASVIEIYRKSIETNDINDRLANLEKLLKATGI